MGVAKCWDAEGIFAPELTLTIASGTMTEELPGSGNRGHDGETGFGVAAARDLLAEAVEARRDAYAPYSDHPVGAALLGSDGRVYRGVNVENASFGLSLCAERAAVANAVTAGATEFIAIAIAGPHDDIPCPPCGACRQVLHEFSPGLQIVTSHGARTPRITPLTELLPAAFDQRALRREPDS